MIVPIFVEIEEVFVQKWRDLPLGFGHLENLPYFYPLKYWLTRFLYLHKTNKL